jgi:ribosomal protein S18 acetylase RimI-like enzyme
MPASTIRPAKMDDVPVILELIGALGAYEKASPDDITADEEDLRRSLFGAQPAAEVLVACEGETVVGFAVFFHNYSTWRGKRGLYLEDLFVKPEARGRGHGKRLFLEVAKAAKDRDCARMDWSVLDWNQPAIDFYCSLGAEPLNEWTTYRLTRAALERL